ncbi:MAG: hypothetical protein C0505_06725 [Leptothrix sp. (in: Bacteria)]|nr:hypothetical protein [Leptothrix sp. (in: b-proteobacteria)]
MLQPDFDPPPSRQEYPMSAFQPQQPIVRAVVSEVLPGFGLAFAVDAEHREWTITKATPGDGLEGLGVGSPVQLQLVRHEYQVLVSEYRRTD